MHKNNLLDKTELLKDIFIREFLATSKNLCDEEKEVLNKISLPILSKWFFSAILNNTMLTPANILNASLKAENSPNVFRLKTYINKKGSLGIRNTRNSIRRHSFIKDLQIVCNYFDPVNEFEYEHTFPAKIPEDFRKAYISDTYYYNYLLIMAKTLNLIKPMDSIGTVKYQKDNETADAFFKMTTLEILKKITDTALVLFKINFTNQLRLPLNMFDINDFIQIIKTSIDAEDIFAFFYKALGFDFKNIVKLSEKEKVSVEEEILLSSVYYMGTIIDKWFFTPFGLYLDILTPIYLHTMDFEEEIDFARPLLLTNCDMTGELFSSCNYFYLTPIGEKIFQVSNHDEDIPLSNMLFTYDQLFSVLISNDSSKTKLLSKTKAYKNLLVLEVGFESNKELWKTIEIPEEFTLNQLYTAIINFFGFEPGNSLKFRLKSKDGKETPINFISVLSTFTLKELKLNNYNLSMIHDLDKSINLLISMSEKKKGTFSGNFPRLLRQSREITLIERNEDMNF